MRAFVSLHLAKPDSQGTHETTYAGYERQEIDYFENFALQPVEIYFPECTDDSLQEITHMQITTAETGNGEILKEVGILPYIRVIKNTRPRIVIADILNLPETLNPIARVAYELVYRKYMQAEDLHPSLFEIINHELEAAGVPILTCTRSGTAHMKSCFASLSELSDVLGNG